MANYSSDFEPIFEQVTVYSGQTAVEVQTALPMSHLDRELVTRYSTRINTTRLESLYNATSKREEAA